MNRFNLPQKILIVIGFLLLILHYDFWNWSNGNLIFDFLPTGLAYHICYSVASGFYWLIVSFYFWPKEFDEEPS